MARKETQNTPETPETSETSNALQVESKKRNRLGLATLKQAIVHFLATAAQEKTLLRTESLEAFEALEALAATFKRSKANSSDKLALLQPRINAMIDAGVTAENLAELQKLLIEKSKLEKQMSRTKSGKDSGTND